MNIKATIQNGAKEEFKLVNYMPEADATLDEAIDNIMEFSNYNNVVTNIEEIRVNWDDQTDLYKFYQVQIFNASMFDNDIQDDSENLLELSNYIEYKYYCVEV